MNTLGALWVVMVSRFIIFHWNEITYCNCLSVTDQQIWQRKALLLLMGSRNRREWMDWAKFCSDSFRGNISREGGRERASALHSALGQPTLAKWPKLSEHLSELWREWAADPGWCVRLVGSGCFMGSVSDTAAQQFLDNINYYISWRLCWGFVPGAHQSAGGVSFAQWWSIWIVCFQASQPFLLYLKEEEQHLGIRMLGAKGSLQEFGGEDYCTRDRHAPLRAPPEVQLAGLSNQNCITCLVERWAVLILPVGRQQFQPYEDSRAGCSCWGRGCLFHLKRISQLCSSRRQRAHGVIKMEACHRQGNQPQCLPFDMELDMSTE